VTVLSVDLASRRYRDNGIALLREGRTAGSSDLPLGDIAVELLAPGALGLVDPPQPDALARALLDVAEDAGARVILLEAGAPSRAHWSTCATANATHARPARLALPAS
jgi:hypothetical protein